MKGTVKPWPGLQPDLPLGRRTNWRSGATSAGWNEHETAIVAGPAKGSALWKVGNRSFQVEHVVGAREREITWTDERMEMG